MGVGARPNSGFRVSPVDRLGRIISPPVLDAAEEIGHRAILHAEKLLIDPAVAASLLEEAAAVVSRVLDRKKRRNQEPVRDLRAYLFRAFIRRVNRTKKREFLVSKAVRLFSAAPRNSIDPLLELELKILIDELLTRSDPVIRDMFYRRSEKYSWKEIGLLYGVSGHAAESRFSQAIRRLANRLGLKSDS